MPNSVLPPSLSRARFLEALTQATGLSLTFVEAASTGVPKLGPTAYASRCRLCRLLSSTRKGLAKCQENDRAMIARSAEAGGGVLSRCHAGLVELLIPWEESGALKGWIFAGQSLDRARDPAMDEEFEKRLGHLGLDARALRSASRAVPQRSRDELRHAANLILLTQAARERSLDRLASLKRAQSDGARPLETLLLPLFSAIKPELFKRAWRKAFPGVHAPRALWLAKLPGDLNPAHFTELSHALEEAEGGSDFVLTPLGGGLLLGLVCSKGPVQASRLDRLANLCRATLRARIPGVMAASGLPDGAPLGASFYRALAALDAEEFLEGKQALAADELEDALPRRLERMADELRLGRREGALESASAALQSALSRGANDEGRRAALLEVLRGWGAALQVPLEQRARLQRLMYLAAERLVKAPLADAALAAVLLEDFKESLGLMAGLATSRQAELAGRVKDWLEAHFAEKLSVRKLAADFGVSAFELPRLFRRESGTTIKNHLARRRVTEAARLLVESELGVPEISRRVGYSDFHYFCLVFKKLKGLPPVAFRRSERARELGERGAAR